MPCAQSLKSDDRGPAVQMLDDRGPLQQTGGPEVGSSHESTTTHIQTKEQIVSDTADRGCDQSNGKLLMQGMPQKGTFARGSRMPIFGQEESGRTGQEETWETI